MDFNLSSPAGGEFEIILNSPDKNLPHKLPSSQTDIVKARCGAMYFHHFHTHEFSIRSSVYDIKESTTIRGRSDISVLEIHGCVENKIQLSWDGIIQPVQQQDQYNMSFVPHVDNTVHFNPGYRYRTFDIHPTPLLLKRYVNCYPLLEKFLNKVENKIACSLISEGFFLTGYMKDCLARMMDYYCNPGMAASFYEGKVKEFMIMMLDKITYLHDKEKQSIKFTGTQNEAADAVKDILIADISKSFSIEELAKKVGMNECILKKCFKHRFGNSIHQYYIAERMNTAKKLLLDPYLSVYDISTMLGYADKQNFYVDFKKYFKITPGQWCSENNISRKEVRDFIRKTNKK